jgi:hypothetical protein
MSIIDALPRPRIPPLGASDPKDFWPEQVGNGDRISLDVCQTCDDPFFRSPGSVSCSVRVPAVPMAGLLREPHLLPVQPIRQWHRRAATPSTIHGLDVGSGAVSVKNGRPGTAKATRVAARLSGAINHHS